MKIAVPLEDGHVCMHFGQSREFAFFEVDEAQKKILSCQTLPAPAHEHGCLPVWLSEQGADAVIAGGMGQHARELFAQHDIHVTLGAPPAPVEEVVVSFLNDALTLGDNRCEHGHGHDHGDGRHGHGHCHG